MQILFNPIQNNLNSYKNPSFKMKMNELKGIDQFVAKKYKINPQPFKTLEQFQKCCKNLATKIKGNDFSGRQQEAQIQRKVIIEDWYKYITEENKAYTGAIILMIMGGITSGLKQKENTLPPVLNKGVLADTIEEIRTNIPENPDNNAVSFNKQYQLNLQKSMMSKDNSLDKSLNGWIVIPSKKHDPKNFKANVDKLKMLSHKSWCTKSFNAVPYLKDGDFHVYMKQGKPKLGVRFIGNLIEEIQGEKNNSMIPVGYYDVIKEHIKNYELRGKAKEEIEKLEKANVEIKRIKSKFPNGIENAATQEILEALEITCKKDTDGMLIISHYGDSDLGYSYSDLGINENKLFKDIKVIKGDAYFSDSQVTDLSRLESIGRDAYFSNSKVTNLSSLKYIGGNAYFRDSKVTDLRSLKSIGGNADFESSQVTNLSSLKSIGRDAYFSNSKVTDLSSLEFIGRDAYFIDSQVTNLNSLESIGRDAYFSDSQVTNLSRLESIGRHADFSDSQIIDLRSLKSIGGLAYFRNSKVTNLSRLEYIGGNAYFRDSKVTDLSRLKSITKGKFYS